MAALQIEDLTGSVEVVVFARVFEECVSALRPDAVIVVRGKVEAGRTTGGGTTTPGAEEEDRVDLEPPQILAEAVFAYDDPRLATWRRDSNRAHQRQRPRRWAVSERSGSRSRSIRVTAQWSSTSTRGTSVDEVTLAVDFAVEPLPSAGTSGGKPGGRERVSRGDASRSRP